RGDRSIIEVVHGYGSTGEGGEIRKRLRLMLERNQRKLSHEFGDRKTGNPGVTYVKPFQALPTASDALQAEILSYCVTARAERKIIGEFRNHGQKKVKTTLKQMAKNGTLKKFQKGAYTHYQAK
ncbi:MAG: Smr/MutS family protein, partial [Anaerolineales bacterium]|nr:Smr/MutS family protein [Anaerolineales bacterium]